MAAPSVKAMLDQDSMLNFNQALVSTVEVALHELGTMLKACRV